MQPKISQPLLFLLSEIDLFGPIYFAKSRRVVALFYSLFVCRELRGTKNKNVRDRKTWKHMEHP